MKCLSIAPSGHTWYPAFKVLYVKRLVHYLALSCHGFIYCFSKSLKRKKGHIQSETVPVAAPERRISF